MKMRNLLARRITIRMVRANVVEAMVAQEAVRLVIAVQEEGAPQVVMIGAVVAITALRVDQVAKLALAVPTAHVVAATTIAIAIQRLSHLSRLSKWTSIRRTKLSKR